MPPFDPYRLTLARWAAAKTKKDLATQLAISPASVTQYEAGNTQPPAPVVAQMALSLGVPVTYFDWSPQRRRPVPGTRSYFRSLRATRQWERDQADALAEHVYDLVAFLESRMRLPEVDLPDAQLSEEASRAEVEQAAEHLRSQWGIGSDRPVANMVRLLEVRGVVVTRLKSTSDRLDAFSRWFETRPVVMLWDRTQDKARSRFDAAHELAHLVIHAEPEFSNRLQERQAHAFAAALLMPRQAIIGDLPRRPPRSRDWETLEALQDRWGVSIAALLYRARELGTLSESGFRRSMVRYSEAGLRDRDGERLGRPEEPRLLQQAVDSLLDHKNWDLDHLARELRVGRKQVEDLVNGTEGDSGDAAERKSPAPYPGADVIPLRSA